MDPTEDVSARILLRRILNTDTPRTPVTRSASQGPSGSGLRRSTRTSRKSAPPQTPQNILRRSLKHKVHESITRKSLPATKLRTSFVVLRSLAPSPSMLLGAETPRHLLRNVLQTEPVKSPVVHEEAAAAERPPPSDEHMATRTRSSIELSGLDLPDLTLRNVVSTAKGLSRKRPRRSLNVTTFEKRLKEGNDAEEESEHSLDDQSSLSLSSSTSLSLKTPFVDVHTEKRGLRRRASNRRKITEEEFSAALSKQERRDASRHGGNIGEDTNMEGITLGLSKLSEPDITADIVNCDTALYDQRDAMSTNFSFIATQDKSTVMASQLQRDVQEEDWEHREAFTAPETYEGVPASRGKEDVNKTERQDTKVEGQPDDAQEFGVSSKSEEQAAAVGYQTFDLADQVESGVEEAKTEEEAVADTLNEAAEGGSQSEEEEAARRSQAGDEDLEQSEAEEEAVADFQTDDVETGSQYESSVHPSLPQTAAEGNVEPQTEEEVAGDSQSEDAEGGAQSEEEGAAGRSQAGDEDMEQAEEEAVADSQTDAGTGSQSEEEEAATGRQTEDKDGSESQAEDAVVNKSQSDAEEESQAEEDEADEGWGSELLDRDVKRLSRRAYRSEGGLVLPAIKAKQDPADSTAAGETDEGKSTRALGLNSSPEVSQSQAGKQEGPNPPPQDEKDDSGAENDAVDISTTGHHSFSDFEVCGQQSPEEAAAAAEESPAEEAAEQEEEWEEDDDEEFPCKTPAFVREKRTFFTSDPPASPSAFKNVPTSSTSKALPAAKPKQVRRRRTGPSREKPVLPKTYVMNAFRHFAKAKVSADVFPVLNEILDKFFDRAVEDLEAYAAHAKRKTIEVEDVLLLLRRQGHINDKVPVEVLIEKYLRLEQRKMLIPVAKSGNVIFPKIRK